MSKISEAILNAAVANIGESKEDALFTRNFLKGQQTSQMLDTAKAKERSEDRWSKEQDRLTDRGLDENSPRWKKAEASIDATLAGWTAHFNSISTDE